MINENTPNPLPPFNPPPIPPVIPQTPPHEFNAADKEPFSTAANIVDCLLRQPGKVLWNLFSGAPGRPLASLLLTALACSLVFGFIIGTFSKGDQLWAAPLKFTATLFLSALICLPSLYIFSCLVGSRIGLSGIVGLLAGLLSLTSILLVGFAPIAWVFSESTKSLPAMGALYLIFSVIALCLGLRFFWRGVALMKSQSDGPFRVWIAIFLLVALQMTTALRPILGASKDFFPAEKKFFVSHWIDVLDQKEKHD